MSRDNLKRVKRYPLLFALLGTFFLVGIVYISLEALIDWQVHVAIRKDAEIRARNWSDNFFQTTPSAVQMIETGVAPEDDFARLDNSFALTGVIRFKLFDDQGMLTFLSDNGVLAPTQFFSEQALQTFQTGQSIITLHEPEVRIGLPEHLQTYVEVLMPAFHPSGERIGTVEVSVNVGDLEEALEVSFRQISGYLIAGTILILLVPAAAYIHKTRQMIRQDRTLLEYTRYDQLTGTFNRNSTTEILADLFDAPQVPLSLGILFVDLDHFKQVNDQFGHAYGDSLLQHTARILKANLRGKGDYVGRFGEDEFVVLCPDIGLIEFRSLYGRIMEDARKTFYHESRSYVPSLSTGAYIAVDGDTAKTALHRADLAVYAAKRSGRGQVIEYSRDLEGLFTQDSPRQTA